MGYAKYNIGDGVERGYAVTARCQHPGCEAEVDRGLAHLCYSCTQYFCARHLYVAERKFECFAGSSAQCCPACRDAYGGEDDELDPADW